MKIGQKVNLYSPKGERQTAVIADIVGAGESLNKELNLVVDDVVYEKVPHYDDSTIEEAFWMEKGDRLPKGWDEPAREVVEEAVKTAPKKKKGR
jgi:hypothetical protein